MEIDTGGEREQKQRESLVWKNAVGRGVCFDIQSFFTVFWLFEKLVDFSKAHSWTHKSSYDRPNHRNKSKNVHSEALIYFFWLTPTQSNDLR